MPSFFILILPRTKKFTLRATTGEKTTHARTCAHYPKDTVRPEIFGHRHSPTKLQYQPLYLARTSRQTNKQQHCHCLWHKTQQSYIHTYIHTYTICNGSFRICTPSTTHGFSSTVVTSSSRDGHHGTTASSSFSLCCCSCCCLSPSHHGTGYCSLCLVEHSDVAL